MKLHSGGPFRLFPPKSRRYQEHFTRVAIKDVGLRIWARAVVLNNLGGDMVLRVILLTILASCNSFWYLPARGDTPESCFETGSVSDLTHIFGPSLSCGGPQCIVGYHCSDLDVVVPTFLNGLPITEIGERAFYQKGLTSIVLPDTLEIIGESALSGNRLRSIKLPRNLKIIRRRALEHNRIGEVSLPNGLNEIGYYAFLGNPLRDLDLDSTQVSTLQDFGLYNHDLVEVTIPKNIRLIDRYAFSGRFLSKIVVESAVELEAEDDETLGQYAESFHSSFPGLTIQPGVYYFGGTHWEKRGKVDPSPPLSPIAESCAPPPHNDLNYYDFVDKYLMSPHGVHIRKWLWGLWEGFFPGETGSLLPNDFLFYSYDPYEAGHSPHIMFPPSLMLPDHESLGVGSRLAEDMHWTAVKGVFITNGRVCNNNGAIHNRFYVDAEPGKGTNGVRRFFSYDYREKKSTEIFINTPLLTCADSKDEFEENGGTRVSFYRTEDTGVYFIFIATREKEYPPNSDDYDEIFPSYAIPIEKCRLFQGGPGIICDTDLHRVFVNRIGFDIQRPERVELVFLLKNGTSLVVPRLEAPHPGYEWKIEAPNKLIVNCEL